MRGNLLFDFPRHMRFTLYDGCNLRCDFCAIRTTSSLHTRGAMTKEVFKAAIVNQIRPELKRLDIANHGEPTLHPNIIDYIAMLREQHSHLQISVVSNTEKIPTKGSKFILQLFNAGLNFLHVDFYNDHAGPIFYDYLRIHKDLYKQQGIRIIDFYNSGINSWNYHGPNAKYILICDDKRRKEKITRRLHNVAGNMSYKFWQKHNMNIKDLPMLIKCVEPFRSAAISVEGKLILCCADWSESCVIADLTNSSLYDAWNSEHINKIRYALQEKRRDIIPTCRWCNMKCFRVGLFHYEGTTYNLKNLEQEFKQTIKPIYQHELLKGFI